MKIWFHIIFGVKSGDWENWKLLKLLSLFWKIMKGFENEIKLTPKSNKKMKMLVLEVVVQLDQKSTKFSNFWKGLEFAKKNIFWFLDNMVAPPSPRPEFLVIFDWNKSKSGVKKVFIIILEFLLIWRKPEPWNSFFLSLGWNFLQNLKIFFFLPGCNLFYLPPMLNLRTLKHVRMFENENLTHYPAIYEQYIPPMLHFSCPQKLLL